MQLPQEYSRVTLETQRLIVREFQEGDAEAIQVYAGDPDVIRFTSFGPNTPEGTSAILANWLQEQNSLPRTEWPLAIVHQEEGVLIGSTGIGGVDWSTGAAIFGYVLRRSAWGQGYAAEASRAVSDWALGELGLRRLVAHCEPANIVSIRVLQKIGFAQQNELVSLPRVNGEIRSYLTFVKERR